jgi:hypothetical protein
MNETFDRRRLIDAAAVGVGVTGEPLLRFALD